MCFIDFQDGRHYSIFFKDISGELWKITTNANSDKSRKFATDRDCPDVEENICDWNKLLNLCNLQLPTILDFKMATFGKLVCYRQNKKDRQFISVTKNNTDEYDALCCN